jgi:hypothetical protein
MQQRTAGKKFKVSASSKRALAGLCSPKTWTAAYGGDGVQERLVGLDAACQLPVGKVDESWLLLSRAFSASAGINSYFLSFMLKAVLRNCGGMSPGYFGPSA